MLPPAPMLATKKEREDGEWRMENRNFRRSAGFHLPASIFHLLFLTAARARPFPHRLLAVRPACAAQRQKVSGPRRLCRRGGAIEDRHVAAGHQRAGVELPRAGVSSCRPAHGRGAGLPERAEVRPRPDGGALQPRLPLARTKQARRRPDGIHRVHAAAQQRARRLAQARAGTTARA